MYLDIAKSNTNKPALIIQSTRSDVPEEIRPYLPSYEAQRKKIKRVRVNTQTEPLSIDDLNIPKNLKFTLSHQQFLIKESSIGINNSIINN